MQKKKKKKAKIKQKLYDKWTEFMNLFSHFSYVKYNEKNSKIQEYLLWIYSSPGLLRR